MNFWGLCVDSPQPALTFIIDSKGMTILIATAKCSKFFKHPKKQLEDYQLVEKFQNQVQHYKKDIWETFFKSTALCNTTTF